MEKPRGGFLSEATYRRLETIQTQFAKGEVDRALEGLDRAMRNANDPFERAVILRTRGNLLLDQGDLATAVPFFENALRLDELTLQETRVMLYNVAQLHASLDDFAEAIAFLDLWRPLVSEIPPEAHLMGAAAYQALNRLDSAIAEIRAAIGKSPDPKEQWFQFLFALLVETGDFPAALETIQVMLDRWPDRAEYWKQFASLYTAAENEEKALAVYEIALRGAHLKSEAEILNVVGLYMFTEVPHKAALLLERKIAEGVVAASLKNLETLGNAWYRAQEVEKAVAAFRAATRIEENARIDLLAAQLLMDLEGWDGAIESLRHLVAGASYRKQLDNPGLPHLLLGTAYFESDRLELAREAFRSALEFEQTRRQAAQWLELIEGTLLARAANQEDSEE